MHIKRLLIVIVLLAAGAASLLYGAMHHRVTVEVQKEREILIPAARQTIPDAIAFPPPGMPDEFGSPPPPPRPMEIKMETVTETYTVDEEQSEPTMVWQATIGGVMRLANGQLKRTYSGKPPALCPT